MTPVQVDEALRAVAEPLSLETPVGGDEHNELGEYLSDADQDAPSAALSLSEMRTGIGQTLQTLSERERAIIEQRFGLGEFEAGGPRSVEDIAAHMHLSSERVHQLEVRALRKMRRRTSGTALEEIPEDEDD